MPDILYWLAVSWSDY